MCDIKKRGKLYFLNSMKTEQTHILKEWHSILRHHYKHFLNLERTLKVIKQQNKFN